MSLAPSDLKDFIENEIRLGNNLAAFPQASQQALSLIQQPDVNILELSRVILRDTALTANILRVSNSPFFNASKNFTKIPEAISYIGLEETKHIIYSSFGRHLFRSGSSLKTWRHSVQAAFFAQEIARRSDIDQDVAYIAGLLHDVGKTFLQSRIAPRYYAIMATLEQKAEKEMVIQSEQNSWGYDHAVIGEMLLRRWNFPEVIVSAVRFHHFKDQPDLPVSQCVALANQLAHEFDIPSPAKTTQVNRDTLTRLKRVDNGPASFVELQKEVTEFLERFLSAS